MKKMTVLLIVVLVAATSSVTTCRCYKFEWNEFPPPPVPPDWHLCNDRQYHECCVDEHCFDDPAMANCSYDFVACNDDYECECSCWQKGDACFRQPGACCWGLVCDVFTNVCMQACTSDQDCRARTEIPFYRDLVCQDGGCDFEHPPCEGGKLPYSGDCVTMPECTELEPECIVLPAAAVTREGTSAHFAASVYLQGGMLAPGFTFSWSSSDDQIATVDSSGRATGGASGGRASITAAVTGCPEITCRAELTNYGAGGGSRVVVVDELTGTPVEGARVVTGLEAPVITDADGVAYVGDTRPVDISVFKRDYHYLTLRGVDKNDVIMHLSPLHQLDFSQDPPAKQAGGILGRFDVGMIRCEPPNTVCDTTIALAGLSVPPGLTNLRADMVTGRVMIETEIELGGQTQHIMLPAGLVMGLNQIHFKEYYSPVGTPGRRVAWGMGGRVDLSDFVDKLGAVLTGAEEVDQAFLITGLIPLVSNLYTALAPGVTVEAMPCKGEDQAPDHDNFPERELTLKVKMDRTMSFDAPELAVGVYDAVVVIGGVIVRGAGFVPLGVGVGRDCEYSEDIPDGMIEEPIVLGLAEVSGRIPEGQVQRVVLAFAIELEDDGGAEHWAGRVLFVDSFSGARTLPEFMLPVEASYDPSERRLEIDRVPSGADFVQAVFSGGEDSGWYVLTEDYTSFDLPEAPAEGDRADNAGIYAVELAGGGFQELVEFTDGNMGELVENLLAFSFTEIP